MNNFTIPKNIPYGTEEALRKISENLKSLDTPLLDNKKDLNKLQNGQSAYYFEDGKLYRYTKINDKLHQEAVEQQDEFNFLSELDD